MTRSFVSKLFLVSIALLVFASTAVAQQNLFNVPSGIITPKGEMFFQQQFNINSLSGTSNSTFAFGLGDGWEAGLNLLNYYMYDKTKKTAADPDAPKAPGNPDLMLNVQKGFTVTDFWKTGIGTQAGLNPSMYHSDTHFQNYSWWINSFELEHHKEFGKWYAGLCYSNQAFSGQGHRLATLVGVEIPIIENRLSFQCDGVLGNNDLCVMVLGGVYTFKNHWQLSLGAQVPSPASGNTHGVVIEFTYPGFPLKRLFGR